ncbi:MAG TPA: DUF763 domain-containing protein [Candidatus Pacearchaeota archaeon]|nr:DUF763 domain-containing protein [Candidatus Pacearchaeota archaeon]HPZ74670.1 DUF763 domain-containing protein [Candidatus Pacearchaeota archaeon]HQD89203.1 DUF763 domain-containing protein [Candidatus Pacearchaeota archaeon]
MINRGIATFTLDYGKCPRWLFERMVKLSRGVIYAIVDEYGPDEFIKRISDPVWFQSLGTVAAFDWNSSGLTTILTAALKEAIRGQEKSLGIFICGGKGKTSRKTPDEIKQWGNILALPDENVNNLVYNSKMSAKVDNGLIQDGFQIYHHTFFFSQSGAWSVVQQGMNSQNQTARRYHWYSKDVTDLVCEPHTGIATMIKVPTLDLTSRKSEKNREISTKLIQNNYLSLMKDIKILRKHSDSLSKTLALKFKDQELTFLKLENKEFSWHPLIDEDFSRSKYLEKILAKVCERKPKSYEDLLAIEGVGPKTIRALALVAEVIYGAEPSYDDPARYSFAHGGKDATPYPVDRFTYDKTIEFLCHFNPQKEPQKIEDYDYQEIKE